MKILLSVIIGVSFGWRAAGCASERVNRLRMTARTFGEAHVTDHELTPYISAVVNGLLGLCLILRFEAVFVSASFAMFFAVGTHLALVDIDTHLLPRDTVLAAFVCAVPLLMLSAQVDSRGSIVRMIIGSILMWSLLRVLQIASRGDLGGGDVRLGALLGLYLGWISYGALFQALVLASAIAGIYALLSVAAGRANRTTHFAFGPFLVVGTVVAVLR